MTIETKVLVLNWVNREHTLLTLPDRETAIDMLAAVYKTMAFLAGGNPEVIGRTEAPIAVRDESIEWRIIQ